MTALDDFKRSVQELPGLRAALKTGNEIRDKIRAEKERWQRKKAETKQSYQVTFVPMPVQAVTVYVP